MANIINPNKVIDVSDKNRNDFIAKNQEELIPAVKGKGNIYGWEKVIKNLDSAQEPDKIDHLILLEIGIALAHVDKIEFEKKKTKTTPHDIILTFKGTEIVLEVKRIRETKRHEEIFQDMLTNAGFVEIIDKGEFGKKLIKDIIDDKYPQLEDTYPNIILIASKDILFRADNVQDAASEILRYSMPSFYPNYCGIRYNILNALFHFNENTGEINGFPVYNNKLVDEFIKTLDCCK